MLKLCRRTAPSALLKLSALTSLRPMIVPRRISASVLFVDEFTERHCRRQLRNCGHSSYRCASNRCCTGHLRVIIANACCPAVCATAHAQACPSCKAFDMSAMLAAAPWQHLGHGLIGTKQSAQPILEPTCAQSCERHVCCSRSCNGPGRNCSLARNARVAMVAGQTALLAWQKR